MKDEITFEAGQNVHQTFQPYLCSCLKLERVGWSNKNAVMLL
jgi:hypothetical protein